MFLKKALENLVNRSYARVRFGTAGEVIERRPGTAAGRRAHRRCWHQLARVAIRGIEAVHMIREGRVLAITRNLNGQVRVFGELLGVR